jgi:hypothetical protein
MKNGIYTMKHHIPVVMTMQDGENKETMDVVTITFLYTSTDIHILSIVSKLDAGNINLPQSVLHDILHKMKEKAASID